MNEQTGQARPPQERIDELRADVSKRPAEWQRQMRAITQDAISAGRAPAWHLEIYPKEAGK